MEGLAACFLCPLLGTRTVTSYENTPEMQKAPLVRFDTPSPTWPIIKEHSGGFVTHVRMKAHTGSGQLCFSVSGSTRSLMKHSSRKEVTETN